MQLCAIYVHCADDTFNMLQIPFRLQLRSSESRKIASNLQMPVLNAASAMRFDCKWYDALNFAPVCCCASDLFWFRHLQAFYSVHIFSSKRCKIITRFSDIIPNLANVMQFADVSFSLMQILRDGKVPSNKLMLHKTMQCTSAQVLAAAKCIKLLQTPSNFAQILRSLEILTLYADLFGLLTFGFGPSIQEKEPFSPFNICCFCTRRDAYTQGCLHTWVLLHRDAFGKGSFLHTNLVLLHSNAFMHRCFYTGTRSFYTQMRRYFYTQMPLHSDAFTPECFYSPIHLLLHGDSFDTK